MKMLIRTLLIIAVITASYPTHSCSVLDHVKTICEKKVPSAAQATFSEEGFGVWLLSSKLDY